MNKTAFLLATLVAVMPACATAATTRPNIENRFAPMVDNASVPMTNDTNVELWEIQPLALPAFAAEQIAHTLKSCMENPNLHDLKVFAYESDYNRANKLPPSYLIDTAKLVETEQKNCIWTPICSEAGCRVFGLYATGENQWEITISPFAIQWGVQPIGQYRGARGQTVTQYEIWTISNTPQCANPQPNTEVCLSDYVWSGNRLTPVKVNR